MKAREEKRRKIYISSKETTLLRDLFIKVLIPFIVVIAISSVLLFLGMKILLTKTNFMNYGIAPSTVLFSVSQFISIYIIIFIINLVLLLSLSGYIFYFMVHNLILPIIRITNELKSEENKELQVRKNDVFIIPLVKSINKLVNRK